MGRRKAANDRLGIGDVTWPSKREQREVRTTSPKLTAIPDEELADNVQIHLRARPTQWIAFKWPCMAGEFRNLGVCALIDFGLI